MRGGRDPKVRSRSQKKVNENNITIYEEDSEYGGKHLSREHTFTLCIASKTRRTTARPKDQPPNSVRVRQKQKWYVWKCMCVVPVSPAECIYGVCLWG